MYLEARNETHVLGSEIAHQHATDRPVDHVDARYIAGTYSYIVTLVVGGGVEAWQIVRIMTEVGVHLEDEVVAMLQGPLEALDVGGAETQLALTLQDVEAIGKLAGNEFLDDGSRAIRTSVVDDKDVEFLLQAEDGTDDFLDVFLLVATRRLIRFR